MKAPNPWFGLAIGFVVLAAYVVIPEANKYGWSEVMVGYLVGTATGAGIVGALIGWAVCFFWRRAERRKSN